MELLLRKTEMIHSEEELKLLQIFKGQLKGHLLNNPSSNTNASVRAFIHKSLLNDILLLKYLRGRKGNVENAFNSLLRYAQVSSATYPDLFQQQIIDKVRHVLEKEILTVFRYTDDQGRIIVMQNTAAWDPSVVTVHDLMGAGVVIMEALMDHFPCRLFDKGTVFLINAQGAGLAHLRQYTIPAAIKFFSVFLHSYPVPVKGLYYVNMPFITKPVYALLRPFIPAKLKQRILVAQDVQELHKRISKHILPACLGGTLLNEEATSLSFLNLSK